jgi:hypothetical protein
LGAAQSRATCKSLVSIRMKGCGSRWKHQSGNEILQLRALQLSDRWDVAMPRILSPLRKPVHVLSRGEALERAAAPNRAFSAQFDVQIALRDQLHARVAGKSCDITYLSMITNI